MKIEIPGQLEKSGSLEFICNVRNDIVHNEGKASTKVIEAINNNQIDIHRVLINPNKTLALHSEFLLWAIDEAHLCIEFIINNIINKKINL